MQSRDICSFSLALWAAGGISRRRHGIPRLHILLGLGYVPRSEAGRFLSLASFMAFCTFSLQPRFCGSILSGAAIACHYRVLPSFGVHIYESGSMASIAWRPSVPMRTWSPNMQCHAVLVSHAIGIRHDSTFVLYLRRCLPAEAWMFHTNC